MFRRNKRFTAAICFALCLTFVFAPQAVAAAPSDSGKTEIMPLMEYINDADYAFEIANGRAIMYAMVRGQSATTTKCEVTVELQKKGLLFWNTVETWTTTENNRSAELDVSCAVTAGETYRMIATVTVWSGNDSETQTMTSDTLKA